MSGPDASAKELDVVALATTLPGAAGDGTPEFVLTLAAGLPSSRVVIVAPRIRNGRIRERIDGVDIHRVPYAKAGAEQVAEDAILPALRNDPRLLRQVPRLLLGLFRTTRTEVRERDPDVLHAHWIVPAGLIARLIGARSDTPYIVTAHGADAYALDGIVARMMKRRILRNALAVYPVSTDIAQLLKPLAGDRLGPTIPMGVDCNRLRSEMGGRLAQPGVVLFVGRLSDKKGVDVLLRAVAATPSVNQLRIVGDGPDRAQLDALAAELGITDRVHFVGHANRATVLEEYRRAQIVAVPSRLGLGGDQDGTPVVLMEAMALGIPVIASALGGIAEQVTHDHTGLLVTPGNAQELGDAIAHLLVDPTTANRLAAAAITHAEAELDISVLAGRLEDDIRTRLAASN